MYLGIIHIRTQLYIILMIVSVIIIVFYLCFQFYVVNVTGAYMNKGNIELQYQESLVIEGSHYHYIFIYIF